MDDLLRTRATNVEEAKKGRKKRERKQKKKEKMPTYRLDGKVVRDKMGPLAKVGIALLTIIVILAAFIYIPPLFYKQEAGGRYFDLERDTSAIKAYQTYLKDNPESDFDNDGLVNSLEAEYKTNVWKADTDGDGVSDYAELFLTETSPVDATTILAKQQMAEDEKNGDTINTAYKLDDVIFWPGDYASKTYGAMVKIRQTDSMAAYRFCYYTGWVKFPPYVPAYAYGYADGIHYELQHREKENAWKITGEDEIRLYNEPLRFVHVLSLPFVGKIYLDDDTIGQMLTRILPNTGGFVNCHKAATIDEEPSLEKDVIADVRMPIYDKTDFSRLGSNMIEMKDLLWVKKNIDAGYCVAVSMYSANTGESIGIIYGYDHDGNLLVANTDGVASGKIYITEFAMRMMDQNGTVGFRTWFEWSGFGFDSRRAGDRISFFSSTSTIPQENNEEEIIESTEPVATVQTEQDNSTEENTQEGIVIENNESNTENIEENTEEIKPENTVVPQETETEITEITFDF